MARSKAGMFVMVEPTVACACVLSWLLATGAIPEVATLADPSVHPCGHRVVGRPTQLLARSCNFVTTSEGASTERRGCCALPDPDCRKVGVQGSLHLVPDLGRKPLSCSPFAPGLRRQRGCPLQREHISWSERGWADDRVICRSVNAGVT